MCVAIVFLTLCRIVHRDLHTQNILIDPKLTHATLIDMDLISFIGGVVGVDREEDFTQFWPLQFSSWEKKLCSSMDSQQLATVLVQLFTWDLLRPHDIMDMQILFTFNQNFCTGCGCDSAKPWCNNCDHVVKYFRMLYTWPLHVQRPDARSSLLHERMKEYLHSHNVTSQVYSVFATACEKAYIVPAIWENMFCKFL